MSDNKKYYYLKLKDDFFDTEEIKVLESMDNGYKYSNILLKMYLKSIKRDGLLIFNERIPYNPKMIATVTDHNVNDVKQALVLFQDMGLMEILSDGAIYMLDIQNFIGKSSNEADRIRAYRNKIEEKKNKLLNGDNVALTGDCTNVQNKPYKCTPEIEIDIEKDIELEKDIYIELLEYWNSFGIVNHTKSNKTVKKQIKKIKSNKQLEEIKTAIKRYAQAYKDKNHYYKHKWTLDKFLKQSNGYIDWLDEGQRWIEYEEASSGGNTGDNSTNEKTIAEQMHEGTWEDIEYPL